ncbi:MAG TPA: hypothetical protein VLI05_02700 [Candidatus Saccharimonadia bacterium]|nr:hypothetical protein [Candidatus Saccharimonadia bacterium]
MKRHEIIICSIIFLACSLFAADTASVGLRGTHLVNLPKLIWDQPKAYAVTSHCSSKPAIAGLAQAQDASLRKLATYQTACGSFASSTLMVFTDMPKDSKEAVTMADQMATTLKEYQKYRVTPLVIVEPVASWGFVDFSDFRSGLYDPWIMAYFAELKHDGITDSAMGTWVPFPEANLPYWNSQSVKPEDFGYLINDYVGMQKHYFPDSKSSIMLNSATYSSTDFNWANGEYISLIPYVKNIQHGLVDSFGLQGFPWAPRASQSGNGIYDAGEYLDPNLAKEAADYLGVKQIWLNTGSFARKYTLDDKDTITVSPEKRKDILGGAIDQAIKLQKQGYQVSINLFAQDKSTVDEATDWSYWGPDGPLHSPAATVFNEFATKLNQAKIGLWIFDI